jgi:uncharacterized protein (DUF58 family)
VLGAGGNVNDGEGHPYPFVWLVGLTALTFVQAFRADNGPLLGLGIALLAWLALSAFYARTIALGLKAKRRIAKRAYEDERILVRFAVENHGHLPAVSVTVTDLFPADRIPDKTATIFGGLLGEETLETSYLAECDAKRGLHAVGPVSVEARDPFGLFRMRTAPTGAGGILVYPKVTALEALLRPIGGVRFASGAVRGGAPGHGTEFLGTRPYAPGDAPRLVHWASSARTGELVIKMFAETSNAEVAIYLDLERLSVRGIGRVSTVEVAVRIASSLASHFARSRTRVRLFARGQRSYDVSAGRGDAHLTRILETLAHCRADGETSLHALLEETTPMLERGSTAWVVFSSLEPRLDDYFGLLATLRARGVHLAAILIDARTFLKVYDEQIDQERHAPGASEVVRTLNAHGVAVYTVARGQDLGARLREPTRPAGAGR